MSADPLVVGLGNPGPKYARTRHNMGFFVLDEVARRAGVTGWHEKFSGLFVRTRVAHRSCTLLKPMTYMNLSGRSVSRALQFFAGEIGQLVVVHDEVDLPFGAVRVKEGGGTAGHNGLNSIKDQLGDPGFLRVRLGVGRPERGEVADHVLGGFSSEDLAELPDVVARGADAVEAVLADGVTAAMNAFNRRDGA